MPAATPGAHIHSDGVRYCVWAPEAREVVADIRAQGESRMLPLVPGRDGYHASIDLLGKAGDAYGFRLDGGNLLPDPASRFQQESVDGRSVVIDPGTWQWQDAGWQRPPFRDLVLYELHVGTFSRAGTFLGAIGHLPHLQELGVNAVELMPIGDFPGSRNWGYDGVLLYAPARCYGPPDGLRAFVDAAHAHGIAVILDVVYNHFGPYGNRLGAYTPGYFHPQRRTPWGSAFNFDGPGCGPVRDFFLRNPGYWMTEFHIDGFRLDATHEIPDASEPHILAELVQRIHALGGYAIAEDDRNDARMLRAQAPGGLGFDACWADDFHHSARVSQTAENHAYFQDFQGSLEELISIMRQGWLYCGQHSPYRNAGRGTPAGDLSPDHFVHCLSNHDQTGNRALGERINHCIPAEAFRMLSVLLCLSPYTPMIFMGQEWAASSPFLYFTDHEEGLGKAITEGRRREFSGFPEFSNPALLSKIPDPQDPETFSQSRPDWNERGNEDHRGVLELYRSGLRLRRCEKVFRPDGRQSWKAEALPWGAGRVVFGETHQVVFALKGGPAGALPEPGGWQVLLSSEERRFGGSGSPAWNGETLAFGVPEAIVLVRQQPTEGPGHHQPQ